MDPVFVEKNPEPGSAIARAPAVKKPARFWIFIGLNSNLNSKKLIFVELELEPVND